MSRGFLFLLGLLLLSPVGQAAVYELEAEGSLIEFHVDSTLHKVHGRAGSFRGTPVHFDETGGTLEQPFEISVPVDGLVTKNRHRDAAMLRMFENERHPAILWHNDSMDCRRQGTSEWDCTARGMLTIRGIAREAEFHVTLSRDGSRMHSRGEGTLSLNDFQLKPPSVLGIIRVEDQVTVTWDTVWKNKPL